VNYLRLKDFHERGIPITDQDPIADLRLKIDGFVKNPKKTFYEAVNLDFDSREK
jgi:hypothetical protein